MLKSDVLNPMSKEEVIFQIIDANLNRVSEGLRVIEEVARFVLHNESLTRKIKNERHKLSKLFNGYSLIKFRNALKDIGKYSNFDTPSYKDLKGIIRSNSRRAEEGCRVIEEFSKLFEAKPLSNEIAPKIKEIRFKTYELEKTILDKIVIGNR